MPIATQQRIETQELPEFPFRGPFGGIQSELPLDAIEQFGFSDCLNILFRKAMAEARPGTLFLDPLPNDDVAVGFADFYDKNGNHHCVAFAPTKVYELSGSSWLTLTGALTGTLTDLMSWAVVNNTLLFSQGVDVVQKWDGITAGFSDCSADAVPAKYLIELNTHLIAAFTIEGAVAKTQRFRWTAAGDFTDWTGPNAGVEDILNELGPISGINKAFENGFFAHPRGWTRVIPTSIGTNPFATIPFNHDTRGCFFPKTIAAFGDNGFAYVSRNDIVQFNGSSYESLGAMPVDDGRKQVGARSRILSDLALADPSQVYSISSLALGGEYYQAYWLVIPNVSVWLYNLDEKNWTRFLYVDAPKVIGLLTTTTGTRIMDLIGRIEDQTWSPATLSGSSFLDTIAIGFANGKIGIPSFGTPCETGWFLASGTLTMSDRRHNKTIERFRLMYLDRGTIDLQLVITNNRSEMSTYDFTIEGQNTGLLKELIVYPPKLSGLLLRWQLFGPANSLASFTEFTPIYVTGGEYKNN